VIPAAFDYLRASSIDDAIRALADPDAKALAGGHSLIPMMKLRFARPGTLVDIGRLDLRGIRTDGDDLRIGALATHDEVARNVDSALGEASSRVGDLQVRAAGTLGGSVVHGDPSSDTTAPVLALGARLRLQGPSGEREVAATDFFRGPFDTAIEQQELLLELIVPRTARSAYASVEDPASGYPIAGAAVVASSDGLSVGLTGVAARPLRLELGSVDEAESAVAEIEVSGDDQDWRRHLAAVVVRRAAGRLGG
jgi:carbon-monoxide dehydrogenase medium subunit